MQKLKLFFCLAICLLAVGCTTITKSGSFIDMSNMDSQSLINDVSDQLTSVLPPAKNTLFYCSENYVNDAFFNDLLSTLRGKGYAIEEKNTRASSDCLLYVLDTLDTNSYRFTLYIDSRRQLSRAYQEQNGVFIPVSGWSFKYE